MVLDYGGAWIAEIVSSTSSPTTSQRSVSPFSFLTPHAPNSHPFPPKPGMITRVRSGERLGGGGGEAEGGDRDERRVAAFEKKDLICSPAP